MNETMFDFTNQRDEQKLFVVKNMFVLKLPPFFPNLHGKGKSVAISKLACISQKRIRSYIVLGLGALFP